MGTTSVFRSIAETVSISAGYLLLIGTFFTILRQLQIAEHRSERKAHALACEIKERERMTQALRQNEERYRLLFEGNNDGILLIGSNHKVEVFNHPLTEMLGFTTNELTEKGPTQIVLPEDLESFQKAFERCMADLPTERTAELRLYRRDGSVLNTEASFDLIKGEGVPIGVQVIFRDIRDRKKMEAEQKAAQEQIQHSRHLESLITMAGGIAHDFNNLLQAIIGHVEIIRMDVPETSPIREDIDRIHRAAMRAAGLTNRMLSFSGHGGFISQTFDLTETIRKQETTLLQSVGSAIEIQFDLSSHPVILQGNPDQIAELVSILVTNAVEAIDHDHGLIQVHTGEWSPPEGCIIKCVMGEVLPYQTFGFLEVRDNGCGIDEQSKQRLFEPFFTTKFVGRGLGLPAVQGIVRGLRGNIQVDSTVGEGTSVRILFPLAMEQSQEPLAESQRV